MEIVNPKKECLAMEEFRKGNREEGHRLQNEFVDEFKEAMKTKDHCPCTKSCKYHGKCVECVAIHRAHRDHLPNCFHDMVNERIAAVSTLTEHSYYKTEKQYNNITIKSPMDE